MIALLGIVAALAAGTPIALAVAGVTIAGWVSIAQVLVGVAPVAAKLLADIHPAFAVLGQKIAAGFSAQEAALHAHAHIHGAEKTMTALQGQITPLMAAAGASVLAQNRLGRDSETVAKIFTAMTLAAGQKK